MELREGQRRVGQDHRRASGNGENRRRGQDHTGCHRNRGGIEEGRNEEGRVIKRIQRTIHRAPNKYSTEEPHMTIF